MGASAVTPSEAQIQKPSMPTGSVLRSADLILKNGNIITVDASFTIAHAIAIAGDRIVAVGSEAAVVAHAAPETRIVDLKGKTVVPGLIDGHAHMDREGLKGVILRLPVRVPSATSGSDRRSRSKGQAR
jgi:predicted amidohydrolase YtcJ